MNKHLLSADDLMFDWDGSSPNPAGSVQVYDETLRDGLQATYVRHPTLEEKLQLIQLMDALSIDWANAGFPASSERQFSDIVGMGKAKSEGNVRLELRCAARAIPGDVEAILNAANATGYAFEAGIFIGSSNIRKLVEDWDLGSMLKRVRESVSLAVKGGLTVMFVTEDTTRAHPETVRALYEAAVSEGATKLLVCDTVGSATPRAAGRVVQFLLNEVVRGQKGLEVIWHGHSDRGLALANCMAAVEAGACAVEGTALGVGERAGNAPIELILSYLCIAGLRTLDPSALVDYAEFAARILEYAIPPNQPVVGAEVFNTGSGVHASAIRKALEMGREDIARIVYSGIDPAMVKRSVSAKVGRMAGRSSAILHLRALGIEPTEERVQALLEIAKESHSVLTDADIRDLMERPDYQAR